MESLNFLFFSGEISLLGGKSPFNKKMRKRKITIYHALTIDRYRS